MAESHSRPGPAGQDPTLNSLRHVIETLQTESLPAETTGAIGAAATADVERTPSDTVEAGFTPEVAHERPKPRHWDELVAFAGTLPVYEGAGDDTGGRAYDEASVDALRLKLMGLLDDEALEECRYYGSGLVLRGLAQGLRDSNQRRAAIESAGTSYFEHWKQEGTPTSTAILPQDIVGFSASKAFAPMINTYVADFPPHIKLLYDVLDWHTAERESANAHGTSPEHYTHLSKSGAPGDARYEAGQGIERLGKTVAIATSRVLREVLKLRAGYLARTKPGFPKQPTAQEVIDHTDMDDINLIPVAQRAAAVRLDELRKFESDYLGLDENGRAVFHGKKLPRARDLGPPEAHPVTNIRSPLHTRRLRCPALFVEGLIPDMMSCLIEAVGVADGKAKDMYRHLYRT